MTSLLGHLSFVKIYLNDILIFSEREEAHADHLLQVLAIFEKEGVSINFSKSSFFKTSVTFLGHLITPQGIQPDISKIPKFKENFRLDTMKQIQKTIGFINWFRPYIPKLSERMAPLNNFLQKDIKIEPTEQHKELVLNILEEIEKQPTLHFPILGSPFILQCDVSKDGIGGITLQNSRII